MTGKYQLLQSSKSNRIKSHMISNLSTVISAFIGTILGITIYGLMVILPQSAYIHEMVIPKAPISSALNSNPLGMDSWGHATSHETESEAIIRLNSYVTRRTHFCGPALFGSAGFGDADRPDGAWPVCPLDAQRKNNCVIYSFGINGDFSFDDDVAKAYGCQVHSFDPTMQVDSHKRSDQVTFWNMGLGGTIGVNVAGWNMSTVSGIMKMLNHDRVDVLKMDIEGSEWVSLEEMIGSEVMWKIDQLSLEFHLFSSGKGIRYEANLIRDFMQKFNYKVFAWHVNPYSEPLSYEDSGSMMFPSLLEISMARA